MFEREYRELSVVPRWTIIRTIQKQNVAEHSYYVTLYAGQIADLIDWVGNRALLLDAALRHDLEETYTSDVPGPSKRMMICDRDKFDDYCFSENKRRFGADWEKRSAYDYGVDEIKCIIKVADLMDECFFLTIDQQLGNRAIQIVFENSMMRLQNAISKLPCDKIRQQLVYNAANNAIYAHRNEQSIIPTG